MDERSNIPIKKAYTVVFNDILFLACNSIIRLLSMQYHERKQVPLIRLIINVHIFFLHFLRIAIEATTTLWPNSGFAFGSGQEISSL